MELNSLPLFSLQSKAVKVQRSIPSMKNRTSRIKKSKMGDTGKFYTIRKAEKI
jgi:hypothetical protein